MKDDFFHRFICPFVPVRVSETWQHRVLFAATVFSQSARYCTHYYPWLVAVFIIWLTITIIIIIIIIIIMIMIMIMIMIIYLITFTAPFR